VEEGKTKGEMADKKTNVITEEAEMTVSSWFPFCHHRLDIRPVKSAQKSQRSFFWGTINLEALEITSSISNKQAV